MAGDKCRLHNEECISNWDDPWNDICCVVTHDANKIEKNHIWIGDTGASTHMSNTWEGFTEVKASNGKMKFAKEGDNEPVLKMGTWKGRHYTYSKDQKQLGREGIIELKDVMYIPCLRMNLYSITKGISEGGRLTNKDDFFIIRVP